MQRWYSRSFSTPLQIVEDMDYVTLAQVYWECRYEDMDEGEREEERLNLLESPEKLRERIRAEEASEVEELLFEREAEEEQRIADQEARAQKLREVAKKADEARALLRKLGELAPEVEPEPQPEPPPVKLEQLPPDVEFDFPIDDDEIPDMPDRMTGIKKK